MFFIVIEIAAVFSLALFGITQILIPALNGTPWFPMFRKRKVYRALKDAADKIDDVELENEVQALLERAAELRKVREIKEEETTDEE